MYTFKCYFHPKDDGAATCKGCKLPLCGACQGFEGFCPECVEKRKAVHQLKQLRSVVASRTHMAASTTGRLKLAIQQAGPPAARRPAGPGPLPPMPAGATGSLSPTRPLDPALARGMTRQLPAEPVPQPRRYNPEAVAYKPHSSRAPETRHQPVKRAAKAPAAKPQSPAPAGWAMPFVAGLGVGVALVATLLVGQSVLHRAKPQAKPAHQQTFTRQEVDTARALLGRDAAPLASMTEGGRGGDTPQVGWSGR